MSLKDFVQLLEGEPGCAAEYPGYPAMRPMPPPGERLPQSAPSYAVRVQIAGAMDAARLYQLAMRYGGELAPTLMGAANTLFIDSHAGQIPVNELHQLVVNHWPPPPPQPAVRQVESLVMQYAVLVVGETHFGDTPQGRRKAIIDFVQGLLGHGSDNTGGGNPHDPHVIKHVPLPWPSPGPGPGPGPGQIHVDD